MMAVRRWREKCREIAVCVYEETDNPLHADDHNFYRVEKWTRDGMKVGKLLYAI
jgi:hypothetical protein